MVKLDHPTHVMPVLLCATPAMSDKSQTSTIFNNQQVHDFGDARQVSDSRDV